MAKPRTRAGTGERGATFDTARSLALALPGVEEGTSYGTPALKAGGKLMARLKEDGETLVVRIEADARDMLLRSDPGTFFLTDHYAGHPWVLVRLARVEHAALATLLEEAFRLVAPRQRVTAAAAAKKPRAAEPATAKKPRAAPATAKKPRAAAPAAPSPSAPRKSPGPATADPRARLRALCLALPETSETESHGHATFAVRGKTFAMFLDNHHGDGRVALWCKAPPGAQAEIVAADPRRFFVPPYVGPRGWIGARLDLDPDWAAIASCVEESYRMTAPRRVLGGLPR